MSLKFKPEMFSQLNDPEYIDIDAAKVAQNVFDEWLESQPVVYGLDGDNFTLLKLLGTTHQARLVCIEQIEKPKPCEHPDIYFNNMDLWLTKIPPIHKTIGWYCTKCQEQMKPKTWEKI